MSFRDDAVERSSRHMMELQPFQSAKIIDEHAASAALRATATEEEPKHGWITQDRTFHSNNELWEAVIQEHLRSSETLIKLESFFLFEWFPRSPGLFHTFGGREARDEARHHIEKVDNGIVVYDPYGKISMLDGGIGNLRFRPIDLQGRYSYLMTASSTGVCHQGFPVAVPANLLEGSFGELNSRGCLVKTLVGKLRFIPKELSALYYSYREVPQVYLSVEDLCAPAHLKSRSMEELNISAAVSFASSYEGHDKIYAAYVNFDPAIPRSFHESIQWLEEDYIVGRYRGKILTDFDEQRSHFKEAPFSLAKVMGLSLRLAEIAPIAEIAGINARTILSRQDQIIVNIGGTVYMDAKFKFEGGQHNIGIVGDNAQVESMAVGSQVDLSALKNELSRLRAEARKEAATPDQDIAVAELARAESAAASGDRSKVLAHLKAAGKWTLDVATKIGATLAASFIKEAMSK